MRVKKIEKWMQDFVQSEFYLINAGCEAPLQRHSYPIFSKPKRGLGGSDVEHGNYSRILEINQMLPNCFIKDRNLRTYSSFQRALPFFLRFSLRL